MVFKQWYTSNLAYGSPDTYTYAYNPRLYNRDAAYNDNDNTGYGSTVSMDLMQTTMQLLKECHLIL